MPASDKRSINESTLGTQNTTCPNKKDRAIILGACILLGIIKIILIGADEIIVRNQPLDDLWQIQAAQRIYWFGGDYNVFSFVHLPIFPLWISIVHFTGIPLRIANELAYILSSFWLIYAIWCLNGRKVLSLIIFAALIFHPASFHLLNYCLPDTLYVAILLASLGSLIRLWIRLEVQGDWKYSLMAGIFLALLIYTRKESILTYIIMIYFVFAVAMRQYKQHKIKYGMLIKAFGIPIAAIVVVTLGIKTANYIKFGLFVTTDMSAPGYVAAYNALLRIKPDKPMRFVPITKEVRFKAYNVSEAFSELKQLFEGQFGYNAAMHTRKYMGINDEIAAGWMYWTIKQATALAGHHSSAVEANNYYQRIADEINHAIDNGMLAGRRVWLNFLDPEISNYFPYLYASLSRILKLFITSDEPIREKELTDEIPLSVRTAFDNIANRRAFMSSGSRGSLEGWVFGRNNEITQASLRNGSGENIASTSQFILRPDVAKGFSNEKGIDIPDSTGFNLVINNLNEKEIMQASLVFIDSEKNEFKINCSNLVTGRPFAIVSERKDNEITYAIDKITLPKAIGHLREIIQNYIWRFYGRTIRIISVLAILISPLMVWIFLKYPSLDRRIMFLLGLFMVVVVPRILFFTLIDASSWPGNQPRYVFPAIATYSCLLILYMDALLRAVFNTIQMKKEGAIRVKP